MVETSSPVHLKLLSYISPDSAARTEYDYWLPEPKGTCLHSRLHQANLTKLTRTFCLLAHLPCLGFAILPQRPQTVSGRSFSSDSINISQDDMTFSDRQQQAPQDLFFGEPSESPFAPMSMAEQDMAHFSSSSTSAYPLFQSQWLPYTTSYPQPPPVTAYDHSSSTDYPPFESFNATIIYQPDTTNASGHRACQLRLQFFSHLLNSSTASVNISIVLAS